MSTWGGCVPRRVGRDASPVGSCAWSASTGIDRHRGGPSKNSGGSVMSTDVRFFGGIDWASETHQVCLVAADGKIIGERAFAHGGAGLAEKRPAPNGIVSARDTHCGARSDRPSDRRSPPCNNRLRVFRSRSSREARRLGGHSPLTSIFLTSFWASADFGKVTVRTPFLKVAAILSVSTVSGTLRARSEEP